MKLFSCIASSVVSSVILVSSVFTISAATNQTQVQSTATATATSVTASASSKTSAATGATTASKPAVKPTSVPTPKPTTTPATAPTPSPKPTTSSIKTTPTPAVPEQFENLPSSWAKDAVAFWTKNGLIKGIDENYSYQDSITEYEFAQLIATLYERVKHKTIDVSKNELLSTFINTKNTDLLPMIKSYKLGVLQGVKVFGNKIQAYPKAEITNSEISGMIVRFIKAMNLKIYSNSTAIKNISFNDWTLISAWDLQNIELAYINGYIQTDEDNNINPNKKCSRETAINILYKIVTKYKLDVSIKTPTPSKPAVKKSSSTSTTSKAAAKTTTKKN